MTASHDGSWALWDLSEGRSLFHEEALAEVKTVYTAAEFHPDGLLLATAREQLSSACLRRIGVQLWDTLSQQTVADLTGHTGAVNALAFSENGYHMASGSDDGSVKLWDLRKVGDSFHTIAGSGAAVKAVKFDFSGRYLGTGCSEARVYDTQGKAFSVVKTFEDHSGAVTSVGFNGNATTLFSTSMDRSLKFYGN